MREFKGAFQIARQVFDSDIFFYKPDKWFKIWIFIIGICNHKDNGKFKKGECLTTYREISEYTGATKAQIDMFMRWAKSTTQLTTRKTTRGMYISVVKYSYFQDMTNYKTTQKTTDETNCKRNGNDTIIKNDKNDNNTINATKVALKEPTKVKKQQDPDILFVMEIFKKRHGFYPVPVKGKNGFDLNRAAAKWLVSTYGRQNLESKIEKIFEAMDNDKFCPVSINPLELKNNMGRYIEYFKKHNN